MDSAFLVQEFCQEGMAYTTQERDDGRVVPVSGSVPPLSSSLIRPTRTAASYEIKFLLRREQVESVERWAQHHLSLAPHSEAAPGNAYRIQSLYFDTDQFDVYHQRPSFRRRKFRLCRYGSDQDIYLERKSRSAGRVSKRCTLVGDAELGRLQEAEADKTWAGHWFHRKLLARQLKPRCLVSYERAAYIGMCGDEPIYLTLDRNIRCAPVEGVRFEASHPSIPLLTEEVILELKFRTSMPALFKHLIQEQGLNPSGVSKYRRGVEAWRLAENAREVR